MKKKFVECQHCGDVSFWTCKPPDYAFGYICYECQKLEHEEYVSMVAVAGMSSCSTPKENWIFLDRRMHKDFLKEQDEK